MKAGIIISIITVEAFVFGTLALVALALDDWLGASLQLTFLLGFAAPALVVGLLTWWVAPAKFFCIVPLVYTGFLALLPFIPHTPVKPAIRAVEEIQIGMTESEVRSTLDYHFPEVGRFPRPDYGPVRNGTMGFPLDPTDGRYNAAIVLVEFADGKCTSARFLAD